MKNEQYRGIQFYKHILFVDIHITIGIVGIFYIYYTAIKQLTKHFSMFDIFHRT